MKWFILLGFLLWTFLSIVVPFSLVWWIMLGVFGWTIVSVGAFMTMAFSSEIPDNWFVRLIFLPATLILKATK